MLEIATSVVNPKGDSTNMTNDEINKLDAQRVQDRFFEDEARLQRFQYDSSDKAAKMLSLLHGGASVSFATWLQSSLSAEATTEQLSLVAYLLVAMSCTLLGWYWQRSCHLRVTSS